MTRSDKPRGRSKAQAPSPSASTGFAVQHPVILFALIVITCLLMRLFFLNSIVDRDWPYSAFFYGDSSHYDSYAVSLLHGKLYDNGIPYHPPLYAWVLAAVYLILGEPTTSGYAYKIVMAGINSLTAGLAWIWWRRALGSAWSLPAAALFILNFGALLFSASFDNEVVYLLMLTLMLQLLWNQNFLPIKTACGLGIIMGLAALTRAEHLGLWPAVILYLWILRDRHVNIRMHLRSWSLAFVLSLVVILPWAVRNYKTIGEFNSRTPDLEELPRYVLVTAYGPLNFTLANNSSADGGFSPELINKGLGLGGALNLEDPKHRHHFLHGYSEGLQWLRQHPSEAAGLMKEKLNRWLDGFKSGWGVSNFPAGMRGVRPPVDIFVAERGNIQKWILTLLLAAGCSLSFLKGNRAFLIATLVVLHRLAITLAFFGYARGLIVILPAVIPLLLLPLIELAKRRPQAQAYIAPTTATFIGLFLLHALALAGGDPRSFQAQGASDTSGRIIQDAAVKLWPSDK